MGIGYGLRCFIAAESYIDGHSHVAFGVEPKFAPGVRLQLAPTVHVALRVPAVRVSEFKFVYLGAVATLFDRGEHPVPDFGSRAALWRSVRAFLAPALELAHHNTIMGAFLDSGQRRMLRSTFDEVKMIRELDQDRLRAGRERIMRSFDPPQLPPLDPRRGVPSRRGARGRQRGDRDAGREAPDAPDAPAPAPSSSPSPFEDKERGDGANVGSVRSRQGSFRAAPTGIADMPSRLGRLLLLAEGSL